jgi:hypothetical protein
MRKAARKARYALKRHPQPTPARKWAVVDRRTGEIVSAHYRRKNAIATMGLAESVTERYGEAY